MNHNDRIDILSRSLDREIKDRDHLMEKLKNITTSDPADQEEEIALLKQLILILEIELQTRQSIKELTWIQS